MKYKVYIHPTINKEVIEKLSEHDQQRINNLIIQFVENPYVGDSLQIKSIREKRFNEKRIYFIIFEDLKAILIVGLSNKKVQQKTIDTIRHDINDYRDYVKRVIDKD